MTKRLYRSRTDKMIGGVAGGLAEYFDVDPVFIRIAFVLLLFLSGIGFIAYILLWILVPKTPETAAYAMPPSSAHAYGGHSRPGAAAAQSTAATDAHIEDAEFTEVGGAPLGDTQSQSAGFTVTPPSIDDPVREGSRRRIGGSILIAIGVLFLINNLIPQFDLGDYWPLLFVAGGAWMLWRGSESHS